MLRMKRKDYNDDHDMFVLVAKIVEWIDLSLLGAGTESYREERCDEAARTFAAKYIGTPDEIVVMDAINAEINERMDHYDSLHHFNVEGAFEAIDDKVAGIKLLAEMYWHDPAIRKPRGQRQ